MNLKVVLEIDLGLKCIALLFVALTDILLETHQSFRMSSIPCKSFSLSANRTKSILHMYCFGPRNSHPTFPDAEMGVNIV